MPQKFANAARGFLAAGITDSATTLTLSTGSGALFPVADTGTGAVGGSTDWFKLILDDNTNIEIVYVRTHTVGSDTCSNVMRGQEGTTARAFATGVAVGLRVTAGDMAVSVGREMLYADRTYYVATTGSDSNDGLTVGSPFLTIQKALDIAAALDCNSYSVSIQLADGTYTTGGTVSNKYMAGSLLIRGNATTPSNVIINSASTGITLMPYSSLTLTDLKIQSTSAHLLYLAEGAVLTYGNLVFGATTGSHIRSDGGILAVSSSYTISGGALRHWDFNLGSKLNMSTKTITITGTPAFSGSFIYAALCSVFSIWATTFSGSATGKRYDINTGAMIQSFGQGSSTTWFPGNTTGTTATGAYQA